MDWYIVIKTIKKRSYYYRQKTWREGDRVKTRSEYIGPVKSGIPDGEHSPQIDKASAPARVKRITKKAVDAAVKTLMGKKADNWEHHWEARREGESLVRQEKHIVSVLKGLNIQWTHGTGGAYFNPNTGRINIPPLRCFVDKRGQTATAAYYIVVFHELVHWTMLHTKRKAVAYGTGYAREELVAELGAVVLMHHFNLDIGNGSRHALYFQTWLDRAGYGVTRDEALEYAKIEAERAVRFILKHGRMAK